MTVTVTKDRRVMATYKKPIPAEWIKQMKKAGYRVKEAADGKSPT